MIQVQDLSFSYPNGTAVFETFSFSVEQGQSWAVIGPSGCGKTTLLSLLAGLLRPTVGKILIDGHVLTRPRPRTGLILQDYGLLPWATVGKNAALGLNIRAFYGPDGVHAPADNRVANKQTLIHGWLERMGIDHLVDHYPHQISGGQRQRTAIARTLMLEPDLLLMDEPFGALDAPTRQDLQNLTMQLRREQNLTTIIVTHNIEEAVFMGERIMVLSQPVHHTPAIVENVQAGGPTYRKQETYRTRCRQLHHLMGEDSREVA